MTRKIFAMVPARAGSEGLPHKNIRPLQGVPLIGHSIKPALDCPQIEETFLNSDSNDYLEIGHSLGASIYKRPDHLGRADTTMQAVIADFIRAMRASGKELDAVLVLYPTYPFRSSQQLSAIVAHYCAQDDCDSLIGLKQPDTHPYLCAKLSAQNSVATFLDYDVDRYYRRQDYPGCYELTAWAMMVNADRIDDLNAQLLSEKTTGFIVPTDTKVVDIDTEMDFVFAEFLLERGYAGA